MNELTNIPPENAVKKKSMCIGRPEDRVVNSNLEGLHAEMPFNLDV